MTARAFDPLTDHDAIRARLDESGTLLVACLCAAWCGTCRDYRQIFDALAAAHPHACFVWIDIETHSEWMDDHDIENFPTILIQETSETRFFGTVLPLANVLNRMLSDPAALGVAKTEAPALRALLTA